MEKQSERTMGWQGWLGWVLVSVLGVLSLLAVFRAPTNLAWLLSVLVIEWGHFLVLGMAMGCYFGRNSGGYRWLWGIGVIGALLLCSPWLRAGWYARDLSARLDGALGKNASLSVRGANGQEAPLVLGRLWGASSPDVRMRRYHVQVKDGQKLPLDLYRRSDLAGIQPLVVVIHGGAWRSGDPAQLPALNTYLAGRGFSVAAITYRLTPKHIFPAQIEDVEQMIAWLRAEAKTLQIDADRIALLGRSAGGHLALLAGYRKVAKGIRAVVDLYGPTDLHWSWANPSNPWVINSPQVLRAFLGGTPKEKKAAYDAASPLLFVDAQSPPTLLVQGGRDELVSFRQSRRLAERLKQHRVKHFLLEIPWATHGLDANLYGPSGQLYLYALERFLVATMRLSDQ